MRQGVQRQVALRFRSAAFDSARPFERVATDGIEDNFQLPNLFFKPARFIVNRLVRSEPLDEIDILS